MRIFLVILLVLAGCEQSRISGPSLIAFHAKWCQPCQRDIPLLVEVGKEFPATEIDFERQHDIAAQYRVSVLPTYIVLSGGEEVVRTANLRTAIQALRSLDQ